MAKIYPDLAGVFRGSVGKVTYYLRESENIARRKGEGGHSSQSPEAVEQRQKFGLVSALASIMLAAIKLGFPRRKKGLSETNAFHSLNKNVCTVADGVVTVDYERLKCAKGRLVIPEVTVSYDAENSKVLFSQEEMEEEVNCSADDMVYGVLLESKQGFCRLVKLRVRGESGSTSMNLPATWNKDYVVVYVFAVSADKTNASQSRYLSLEAGA